jgi:hypothetical protein
VSTTRIYLVKPAAAGIATLVRAVSQAQALRHVASVDYSVSVASQEDLIEALQQGVVVENAGVATDDEDPGEEVARQSMERAHGMVGA